MQVEKLKENIKIILCKEVHASLRRKPQGCGEENHLLDIHNKVHEVYKSIAEIERFSVELAHLILDVRLSGKRPLTESQLTVVRKNFNSLPLYIAFKEKLEEMLFDNSNDLSAYSVALGSILAQQELSTQTTDFIISTYSPVDRREQVDTLDLRRRDSLARLLTLSSTYSVCTAVTIHHGTLIVAMNLDSESNRAFAIDVILKRCAKVQEFIGQRRVCETEDEIELAANDFYAFVRDNGGTNISRDIYVRALMKFTKAVWVDSEAFNNEELQIFQSSSHLWPLEILLPVLKERSLPAMQVTDRSGEKVIDLPNFSVPRRGHTFSIGGIHAEQLIAWRVFGDGTALSLYNQQNPLKMGISKLCCATCADNLAEYPIFTRGKHFQRYKGVFSLLRAIPDLEEVDLSRATVTAAKCSPKRSPPQSKIATSVDSGSPKAFKSKTVARNLFSLFSIVADGAGSAAGPSEEVMDGNALN